MLSSKLNFANKLKFENLPRFETIPNAHPYFLIKAATKKSRFDKAAQLLIKSIEYLPLSDDSTEVIQQKRNKFNQKHGEKLGKM